MGLGWTSLEQVGTSFTAGSSQHRGSDGLGSLRRARVHNSLRRAASNLGSARTLRQGPLHPTLRANPFPEVTDLFCRLPLPTLFCRPEAFSLGDRLRLTVRTGAKERDLPWIFQAHPQDTLLHERSAAFQDSEPCPSVKLFKGQPVLQKETTASSGACGHGLQDRHCVAASFPCSQVAECSRIPFRQTCRNHRSGRYQL